MTVPKGPTPPVALSRSYDLVNELGQSVARYARSHRYILGDRTLTTAYDMLDLLIEARYTRDKVPLLNRANIMLERLRFQVRLAHDHRLLSTGRYGELAARIDEVGRLVGGWRKNRAAGAPSPEPPTPRTEITP
jgi:hypothetical protein